jgi:hypothetical protein
LLVGSVASRRRAMRNILTAPQWDIHEAATIDEAVEIFDSSDIAVTICDAESDNGEWQVRLSNSPNPHRSASPGRFIPPGRRALLGRSVEPGWL